jgi:hypothetical protein
MEFTYNASAVAAGGVINKTDGSIVVVPSLAPVALSPSGGEGTTTVSDYKSETLSCTSAITSVRGWQTIGTNQFTTETEVFITNLRVLDVLTIGMLRATVKSTRTFEESAPGSDDHEFDLHAEYQTVLVKGANQQWREVVPRIDVSMKSVKRYGHIRNLLDETLAGNPNLVPCPPSKLLAGFNTDDEVAFKEHLAIGRPLLGALVDEVEEKLPPAGLVPIRGKHNKLVIPGVGIAKFGELMLKPGRRRVNLLRISFGEIDPSVPQPEATETYSGGALTIASVEGNGSPLWP